MGLRQKRKHDRHDHKTAVGVGYPGTHHQYMGNTVDLSTSGCQIRFNPEVGFAVGAEVEVWLQSSSGMFRVVGHVRRMLEDGTGIGVEFEGKGGRSQRGVDKLIKSCIELASVDPSVTMV